MSTQLALFETFHQSVAEGKLVSTNVPEPECVFIEAMHHFIHHHLLPTNECVTVPMPLCQQGMDVTQLC